MERRLAGGMDEGAVLVDGTVRRPVRTWTSSVHSLLRHLASAGFTGAPEVIGIDSEGREELTYLAGHTVGGALPWPGWTHSDETLMQMAQWLSGYHQAVRSFVPPTDAAWREGGSWESGMVIGHGDPAPYNAVWDGHLVGLIDWDHAGPVDRSEDVAWVAFGWIPLHARSVVSAEGFTAFDERRARLTLFLDAYGWPDGEDQVLALVERRLEQQTAMMRDLARRGDPAFVAMLARGQDLLLDTARRELASLRP